MAHITISENNQKLLAKEFLYLAGQDYDRAKETRLRRIRLARVYGLTNVEIGEELGITEAAVRAILRKDGDR